MFCNNILSLCSKIFIIIHDILKSYVGLQYLSFPKVTVKNWVTEEFTKKFNFYFLNFIHKKFIQKKLFRKHIQNFYIN